MALRKSVSGFSPRPAVGEVFELTIDGDAPWNDPMALVRGDGYDEKCWEFHGRMIEGNQTRKFRLETAEGCSSLNQVLEILQRKGGKISEGQWRVSFAEKYNLLGVNERVGFPDPSWLDEYREAVFPCLVSSRSLFHHADDIRRGGEGWLWLVEVPEKSAT